MHPAKPWISYWKHTTNASYMRLYIFINPRILLEYHYFKEKSSSLFYLCYIPATQHTYMYRLSCSFRIMFPAYRIHPWMTGATKNDFEKIYEKNISRSLRLLWSYNFYLPCLWYIRYTCAFASIPCRSTRTSVVRSVGIGGYKNVFLFHVRTEYSTVFGIPCTTLYTVHGVHGTTTS